jgi:hypothetical protein
MSFVGKLSASAVSLGILAGLSCPGGAETLKADRIVLEVPGGGMTPEAPPQSVSEFKHRQHDVTLAAEVAGADDRYESWERACTPGKNDPDAAAAYKVGTLARTDRYLYSKISRFSKYGIATPRGSWLEHCLAFRSGELAARMTINLPKSALEKGDIAAADIEKIFASARLTAASVADRTAADPRIAFDAPDYLVTSGLPSFTFRYKHNRLPFGINVTLSDPRNYETAKLLNSRSARAWKVGTLARIDEYFYYFVWPDSLPGFALGLRAADVTTRIDVSVSKTSLDNGDITVEDIERVLASARIMPAGESDKK